MPAGFLWSYPYGLKRSKIEAMKKLPLIFFVLLVIVGPRCGALGLEYTDDIGERHIITKNNRNILDRLAEWRCPSLTRTHDDYSAYFSSLALQKGLFDYEREVIRNGTRADHIRARTLRYLEIAIDHADRRDADNEVLRTTSKAYLRSKLSCFQKNLRPEIVLERAKCRALGQDEYAGEERSEDVEPCYACLKGAAETVVCILKPVVVVAATAILIYGIKQFF